MVKIKINNSEYEVRDDLTILQACEHAEKEVPRFCYHDRLSIGGCPRGRLSSLGIKFCCFTST